MDNNSYKAVTIQNIDGEDFVFEYNRAAGNPPYLIKAGQTVTYPFFLAKHAVKHLINKILNKRDISTNNSAERDKLSAQIVVKEEEYNRVDPLSSNQQLKKDIEVMNKSSDLESILGKRKAQAKADKIAEAKEPPKKELPEVDTTDDADSFEGLKTETEPKGVPAPVKANPTRAEMYTYAEDVLKMDMNKKVLDKLDKMKVADVATELDFPLNKK